MDLKKLALCGLIIGSFGAVGCGGDSETTEDTGVDTGTEDTGTTDTGNTEEDTGPAADCTTGESHFFILNALDIPPPNDDGEVPGFNLDGEVTGNDGEGPGCGQADYVGLNGDDGVDNQLAQLITLLGSSLGEGGIPELVKTNIGEGDLLILVEVANVDDLTNDECVNLTLYLGATDEAPEVDGDGFVTAGQTFDLDDDSFNDSEEPLIAVEGASIEGGSLHAGPVDFPLSLATASGNFELLITDAQLSFTIGEDTITNGNLGGGVRLTDIYALVGQLAPEFCTTAMGAVPSLTDLEEEDGVCGSISVGAVFSGVEAVRGDIVNNDVDAGAPVDAGPGCGEG